MMMTVADYSLVKKAEELSTLFGDDAAAALEVLETMKAMDKKELVDFRETMQAIFLELSDRNPSKPEKLVM